MEEMGLRLEEREFWRRQGDSAKLELGVFKIQNQADLQMGSTKIIEHSTHFMIANPFNRLRFYDDFSKDHQIWNVFSHGDFTVENGKMGLLGKRNILMKKFDG